MLAEVSGVVLVFALGVLALLVITFVQRVMGAGKGPPPAQTRSPAGVPDARRRAPLPFARVLLLWLLAAPALAFVGVWSVAVRDLGTPAITALALFAAPLVVAFLALVSKGGLEP
jgi:NADH:ubiquinone oxidoreductase subunit 3 (subunit A)